MYVHTTLLAMWCHARENLKPRREFQQANQPQIWYQYGPLIADGWDQDANVTYVDVMARKRYQLTSNYYCSFVKDAIGRRFLQRAKNAEL